MSKSETRKQNTCTVGQSLIHVITINCKEKIEKVCPLFFPKKEPSEFRGKGIGLKNVCPYCSVMESFDLTLLLKLSIVFF